jgi:small-conductance mechanosensitive channel
MSTVYDVWDWIADTAAISEVQTLLRAAAVLLVGGLLIGVVRRRLQRADTGFKHMALVRRGVIWLLWGILIAWSLRELGLNLGVLLGAAGVLTVALGFASQTSVSNVISGVFLMGERPFSEGDTITVAGLTGEVLSIDLLSIKIRTFDNLLVRVPNELALKSPLTNLTHFPIRRFDMMLSVAYKEDLARVREVVLKLAWGNPICLAEPEPQLVFRGFGESSIDLQLNVWSAKENFLALKTSMHEKIKSAFAAEGIEIPFPHRVIQHVERTASAPQAKADS